jgi:hypothetical protein
MVHFAFHSVFVGTEGTLEALGQFDALFRHNLCMLSCHQILQEAEMKATTLVITAVCQRDEREPNICRVTCQMSAHEKQDFYSRELSWPGVPCLLRHKGRGK